MKFGIYEITPVPKPRQTRADKWQKRDCVLRYRAFADEVRLLKIRIPDSNSRVVFFMPMPNSWTANKKTRMLYQPHQQKPDVDNLLKALMDAILKDDSGVYDIRSSKFWSRTGKIQIIAQV